MAEMDCTNKRNVLDKQEQNSQKNTLKYIQRNKTQTEKRRNNNKRDMIANEWMDGEVYATFTLKATNLKISKRDGN